jgi:eukaryotic-like serine/threonine-protein kinase
MLTGKHAFSGDSTVELMNAILKDEPLEFAAAGRTISPGLERVTSHCLKKNPEEHFQSARDLCFALEALTGVSGTGAPGAASLRWPPWEA